MDLKALGETPPWEWPEDAKATILGVLGDPGAAVADRVLAARLAGDATVIDDEVASALLAVLRAEDLPAELRARAAIAFGAGLEQAEIDGVDLAPELFGDAKLSVATFGQVQDALRAVHSDARSPKEVRRRALEASARAPRKWHRRAVRAAFRDDDADWRLTALFCMGYVPGFDAEIVEALGSEDEAIRHEAVRAAGERSVEAAWPQIAAILADRETEKDLLLAAIEAAATIRPEEALVALTSFVDSADEDVAATAEEALSVAGQCFQADPFEDGDPFDPDDEAVPLDQRDKVGDEAAAESAGTVRRAGARVGRNEPCPCGSGKKYKKCCGR